MLIVFEGIDGCGKGTQIDALCKKFGAVVIKYPTKKYSMLTDYLEKLVSIDSKALLLLFLADIADDQQAVKDALAKNKIVILDRYVFSTIAYELDGITYQGAKKIVESVGYIKPDLVVLMDINPRVSQERKKVQKQLDRYEENVVFQEKVRLNFLKLQEERFLTPNWHKIDASRDIESVHEDILKLIKH